jgi:hypothetical protein
LDNFGTQLRLRKSRAALVVNDDVSIAIELPTDGVDWKSRRDAVGARSAVEIHDGRRAARLHRAQDDDGEPHRTSVWLVA